jgi:HemY protein
MRFALWFLALFALATAAALFAGDNPGTVSIFFPPHRLDVSLNLAVVCLVGFVALLHLTLTSLRGLLGLPQAARAWRKHQRERARCKAWPTAQLTF